MAIGVRGSALQLMTGATSAIAWTSVAEVLDLTGPSPTRERIDVTDVGTTSDYRVWIGSFIDAGTVGFSINYLPTNATHKGSSNGLAAKLDSGTTERWRVLFGGDTSTSGSLKFSGFVSGFNPGLAVGEQVKATCEITVSGAVTWPTT